MCGLQSVVFSVVSKATLEMFIALSQAFQTVQFALCKNASNLKQDGVKIWERV